jgi:hypothetical protein
VILEDADVFQARVPLQILDAQRDQAEELFHFGVGRIPEMAVVAGIFDQNFVGADRPHAIIQAFAAACGFAFYVIERLRMDDRARRPEIATQTG